jgi:drug/metabolite transporter (DMT)-like permease
MRSRSFVADGRRRRLERHQQRLCVAQPTVVCRDDPTLEPCGQMPRRAWLMMGGAAALWGASYMFIKVALHDVSEGGIVCVRTALGAAVLLALAVRWDALGALRGRMGWITAIALVQVVAPFLLITFGENHVDSSLAGILVSSAPIFTALLAIAFDHTERSTGWAAVGILVGMAGVALLFGVDLSGDTEELWGGAMVLLASLGYAVGAMLIKHKARGVPPVAIAGSNMAVSALATLPLFLATLPGHAPSLKVAGSLLVLGVGGTGVAFLFYYTLIAEIGPARASIVAYIAPAFAVLYGVTLLGEPLTAGAVAGLALILAGSWLGAQGRLPRPLSRSEPSRSSAPEPARAR